MTSTNMGSSTTSNAAATATTSSAGTMRDDPSRLHATFLAQLLPFSGSRARLGKRVLLAKTLCCSCFLEVAA